MKKSSESKNVVEQLLMPIPLFTIIAIIIFASMLYMKNTASGSHGPFFSHTNAARQHHYTLNLNNPGCVLINANGELIPLSDNFPIPKDQTITISGSCLSEK